MGADSQFPGQLTVAQNLDQLDGAVGQAGATKDFQIHDSSILEAVERSHIHRDITRRVARIVETPLGNTPDERHLAAFKANPDGTAGPGGLAFTAAAAGLAMAAGFALAKALAAMLGTGTRFKIV